MDSYLAIRNQILAGLQGAPDAPPVDRLYGDALEDHICGGLLDVYGLGRQAHKNHVCTLDQDW